MTILTSLHHRNTLIFGGVDEGSSTFIESALVTPDHHYCKTTTSPATTSSSKTSSSSSSPQRRKTFFRPDIKTVHFCEAQNQYGEAASTVAALLRPADKHKLWYNEDDMDRFSNDFQNATIRLEKLHRHRARVWLQTLHQAYQTSLRHTHGNSNHPSAVTRQLTDQERLRKMYEQDPGLVGIEDMVLPQLRNDSTKRQAQLQLAVAHICNEKQMDRATKEYNLSVLSQSISRPSRIFCNEIAMAQSGSARQHRYQQHHQQQYHCNADTPIRFMV